MQFLCSYLTERLTFCGKNQCGVKSWNELLNIYQDFLGILLFTTSSTNSYGISTAEKWVNSAINHKSSASMLTFFS